MQTLRDSWARARASMAARAFTCSLVASGCTEPGVTESGTDTEGSTGSTTASTTSPTTSGTTAGEPGTSQTPTCADYMACIGEVDPGSVSLAGDRFGPEGTCWTGSTEEADACDQVCAEGIERLCDPGRDSDTATTGEPGPPLCAVQTLSSGESWLVAGDALGEIPTEIGEVLERNCGCHLAELDTFDVNTPLYYGNLRLSTWDDFQSSFQGRAVYEEVRARAIDSLSMPPIYFCGDEAFGSLTEADYELLGAWLDAGAPDAPTWNDGPGTTG